MATNPTGDTTEEGEEEKNGKPPEETTEEGDTSAEKQSGQKTTTEQDTVDYRKKFTESQKEALRLREESEKTKRDLEQMSDIMVLLQEKPELLKQVQSAYDEKYGTASEPEKAAVPTGAVAEKVL